jgi:hypothetical protein
VTAETRGMRRPAATLRRDVCAREFLAPPVVPPLIVVSSSHLARWLRKVLCHAGSEPRGPSNDWTARALRSLRGFIFSRQMKVHFVRQTLAKSYQILSAAAPDSFIFCHSSPHSCIRLRDAGGKTCGCDGGCAGGVGTPIGTAGFAGAGGD